MTLTEADARASVTPGKRRLIRRALPAVALLLLAYVGLSLLNDPRGYLGTDTGGKVATLQRMDARNTLDPDVGYWAQRWDPDGRYHPMYYTYRLAGKWVNVTTLPALYAAYPLFELGGYRGALLIPMAGAVLAALAARAMAKRLGGDERSQWRTFWIVGLASPLTIYALDFWEHSLGVGLMAWGVVLLFDVANEAGGRAWLRALGAGLLFGAAATMRTEALVYGVVATAVSLGVLLWRRRALMPPILAGVAVLAGLLLPLAGNLALERATIGTSMRAGRAAGAITGSSAGTDRIGEAILTGTGLEPSPEASSYLVGAVLLGLLLLLARRAAKEGGDPRIARILFAGVIALYVLRFVGGGLGFVPGMIAAAPLAGIGLAWAWGDGRTRLVAAVALLALPMVWKLQYTGGAAPQWAGRYILTSGLLLVVIGAVSLGRLERWAATGLIALSVLVTAFGLAWLGQRSHDVADAGAFLDRRPEPVLISRVAHLFRETGWYEGQHRWLTALSDEDVAGAAAVVTDAGFDRFGLVTVNDRSPLPVIPGYHPAGAAGFEFISGVPMLVTTYERGP
ncbi:MAG: hypothetical protein ACRD12_07700 [Acidimicrobiales bacterium]